MRDSTELRSRRGDEAGPVVAHRIRLLTSAATLALALLAVSCASRLSRDDQRALTLGWTELAGMKATAELPAIDRLDLVQFDPKQSVAAGEDAFPIQGPDWVLFHPITARKALTPAERDEFMKAWRALRTGASYSALCHHPIYGLRLHGQGRLVLETTVCYECANFTVPTPRGHAWCGFDTKDRAGTNLFALLVRHIPLPPSVKP